MLGKKLQEESSLGGNTAQLLRFGDSFRAFPVETLENRRLNNREAKA
jgi:hypothetical protein